MDIKQTKTIEYKNLLITQNPLNHHVMISKNGEMIFHSNTDKPLSDSELRKMADFALMNQEMFEKHFGKSDDGKPYNLTTMA